MICRILARMIPLHIFILVSCGCSGSEWHVALNGKAYNYKLPFSATSDGIGTEEHPWLLEFALSNPADPCEKIKQNWIKPGDIVWVHEGIYNGYIDVKTMKIPAKDTVGCNCDKFETAEISTKYNIPCGYVSFLEGDSLKPILVRAWRDHQVIFDGSRIFDYIKFQRNLFCPLKNTWFKQAIQLISIKGKFTTFWGFEFTTFNTSHLDIYFKSKELKIQDSDTYNKKGCGIVMAGRGHKLINNIFYGLAGLAIGDFSSNIMSEVQGCIMYNNGQASPDRGHSHAIYAANESIYWKKYCHNIMFNQEALGFQLFKTDRKLGTIRNVDIENNICFNNGCIYEKPGQPDMEFSQQNLYVGGHGSREDIKIKGNHVYRNLYFEQPDKSSHTKNMEIHSDETLDTNRRITIEANYIVGGSPALEICNLRNCNLINNYIVALNAGSLIRYIEMFIPSSDDLTNFLKDKRISLKMDHNHYFYSNNNNSYIADTSKPFNLITNSEKRKNIKLSFKAWKALGIDTKAQITNVDQANSNNNPLPDLVIMDNDDQNYNPGRKQIIIYNLFNKYNKNGNKFDITNWIRKIVPNGSTFVIKDVQNYHSEKKSFQNIQGEFSKEIKVILDLSPGQTVELPKKKDGSLVAGIRNVDHTCPQFSVYTMDFFPYSVVINKKKTASHIIKLTASLKAQGTYFGVEKFSYEWENYTGADKYTSEIRIDKDLVKNITLKIMDKQTGMTIRKKAY
jgi:hypothetical protein